MSRWISLDQLQVSGINKLNVHGREHWNSNFRESVASSTRLEWKVFLEQALQNIENKPVTMVFAFLDVTTFWARERFQYLFILLPRLLGWNQSGL